MSDETAHVHMVALLHDGLAQSADMLLHGDHDLPRHGHGLRRKLGCIFAMGHDGPACAAEQRYPCHGSSPPPSPDTGPGRSAHPADVAAAGSTAFRGTQHADMIVPW